MSFSFADPPKDIEEENSIAEHMFEETTDEEFGANEGYDFDKFFENTIRRNIKRIIKEGERRLRMRRNAV